VPDEPNIPLVDWARKPASMVRVEYEHYQTYMEKIPAMRRKHVTVALDEWAYSGTAPGAYKPVLAYAWGLNELFRHSDVFTMGGFTFAGSTLSSSRTEAVLNPIGLMFALYSQHYGRIPLAVSGNAPQPERTARVGGETPNVNAGSPTYPIDVAAALSEDETTLTLSIVNPTESPRQLLLDLHGLGVSGPGKVWRMAPPSVASANLVGREAQVRIEESSVDAAGVLTIPAISVGVYAFPIRK
jgi:alpha-L-arabinofuranosidase